MTHGSLFSGIGGFDLAAAWAGWTNVFNCEIDPFCRQILKYHFPEAQQYGDLRTTDFTVWRDRVDVLTGGFPCQPFSLAGKRRGTADDRYLWPAMLGVIRTVRPRWVVGENVLGIVNWSNGMVFEQVCADLEAAKYEVQPYIIPAAGVGAPHLRYRTWFVAHRADAGIEGLREREEHADVCEAAADTECFGREKVFVKIQYQKPERAGTERHDGERTVANGESGRLSIVGAARNRRAGLEDVYTTFDRFPSQSPVCRRDDGLSAGLDGITFPAWCRESIKAYGNAIVPQVVLQIFETINEYEKLWKTIK